MIIYHCPHCKEELPATRDAFCSYCHEPLDETEAVESQKPTPAPEKHEPEISANESPSERNFVVKLATKKQPNKVVGTVNVSARSQQEVFDEIARELPDHEVYALYAGTYVHPVVRVFCGIMSAILIIASIVIFVLLLLNIAQIGANWFYGLGLAVTLFGIGLAAARQARTGVDDGTEYFIS